MLRPGISSYAYTWAIGVPGHPPGTPMTTFDLIDKAVDLQVYDVQIADNIPLEEFSKEKLLALRDYAHSNKVRIEVGSKKLTRHRLDQFIGIAADLQSEILRFVIDVSGYTPAIDEVVEIIKDALPSLEKSGIRLALENHDRLLTRQFVDIIKKVDSEWVGICLDTVNSMGAGEGLETVIERLGPLTVNFHVKEFTVKRIYHMMGFEIEGLPLGTGMLPVTKVMEHLGPRCKTAILEQWTPPVAGDIQATVEREDTWARESINFLKHVLKENPVNAIKNNTL